MLNFGSPRLPVCTPPDGFLNWLDFRHGRHPIVDELSAVKVAFRDVTIYNDFEDKREIAVQGCQSVGGTSSHSGNSDSQNAGIEIVNAHYPKHQLKVMTKTVDYRTSSWQSHHDSFVCTPFDFETINVPISLESTPGLPLLRVHEQNRVGEAEGLRQTPSECTNKQREFGGFRRNGVRTGRRARRSSLTKKNCYFGLRFYRS